MTSIQYHRPETLEEALDLLEQGVPLAGGTRISASLRGVPALVDLQDLNLDGIDVSNEFITIGGTATLQGLIDAAEGIPADLVQCVRLEAGWNIRNRATIAGTIVSSDGRSPLLTALLAMRTNLELAPGDEQVSLEEALNRPNRAGGKLITAIQVSQRRQISYAQVARSPVDRPQVCVAIARSDEGWRIALGGFGEAPQLLEADDAAGAAAAVRAAYADAGDQWASAEFRSAAAATLAARLISEAGSE